MLKKIVSVKNVGTLKNHAATGAQTFKRINIVYGGNGTGKTTLGAILDSLRGADPDIVLGRSTLGCGSSPSIQILTNDADCRFEDGQWNVAHTALEVFNDDFVARNVYAGTSVSNDQRKNLCSLVVGATASKAAVEIEALSSQIGDLNKQLLATTKELQGHINGAMPAAGFIALKQDGAIEAKLETARRQVAAAKNQAKIMSRKEPKMVVLPILDGSSLASLLSRGLSDVSAPAIERVVEHIDTHLSTNGEIWLTQGFDHSDSGICPFCAQPLSQSELFESLTSYFSDSYRAYVTRLREDIDASLDTFRPEVLERAKAELDQQREVALGWRDLIPEFDTASLDLDVAEDVDDARLACTEIRALLNAKLVHPLESVDTGAISVMLGRIASALSAMEIAERALTAAGMVIGTFKASVRDANLAQLEQELERLQNVRARYLPAVDACCTRGKALGDQKRKLDARKQLAKDLMNQSMQRVLEKHKDDMNAYLAFFESSLRIEDPRTVYTTTPPSVEYSLSIDGHSVKLGKPDTPVSTPCFRNTLSEGEKNLLALSLFLAHVKNRPGAAALSVVIDDPVNSLDRERCQLICSTIVSLADVVAQVTVLTHEPRLVKMLCRATPSDDRRVLTMVREKGATCLREWTEVDRDLASEYFRNYFTIADFVSTQQGDYKDVARSIRPFLEDYLRQRFPGRFALNQWLGDMIGIIDQAPSGDGLDGMRTLLPDLKSVAAATSPQHHGFNRWMR